jgi:hypothetical protein
VAKSGFQLIASKALRSGGEEPLVRHGRPAPFAHRQVCLDVAPLRLACPSQHEAREKFVIVRRMVARVTHVRSPP